MTRIHELSITLEKNDRARLEEAIELMRRGDPERPVNDCFQTILLLGLDMALPNLQKNVQKANAVTEATVCAA